MTTTRSGIPTTHAGTNFRSRLEARWAAFFDLVGWSWTYEPFDADGWIPDFLIAGERPFLIEVGPCSTHDQFRDKATKPLTHSELPTLVVGVGPNVIRMPDVPGLRPEFCAGWFVNEHPAFAGPCFWVADESNARLAVFQDGEHFPEGSWDTHHHIEPDWLEALWRLAGNQVQWKKVESIGEILARPWR